MNTKLVFIISALSLCFGIILGFFLNISRYIPKHILVVVICIILYGIKNIYDNIPTGYIKMGLNMSKSYISSTFSFSHKENDTKIEDKRFHIDYIFNGEKKQHIVPYNHSKRINMMKYKVELITKENEFINITQHSGTIYKHSAEDYGGDSIKVTNKLTGDETFFLENDIPKLE
uniref:Uncharacterized protein n=1 Tax=Pithovirus LCPAC001 TaxID=2506585 RepID=A0A481Z1M1_9VIRU|nr:MAG: uncharacterized protein LCPAC001_00630 [Pithovirus LCPAC001]